MDVQSYDNAIKTGNELPRYIQFASKVMPKTTTSIKAASSFYLRTNGTQHISIVPTALDHTTPLQFKNSSRSPQAYPSLPVPC
jgi:hypothetical protein